jgi:hypothetical protein
MDPRRLLDEGATGIEKALLRAGREDGPRQEAAGRVLAAIQAAPLAQLPPAGVESAAGGAVAVSAKALTLATWAKISLVAAGLGGAAAVSHHHAKSRALSEIPAQVTKARPVLVPAEAPVPSTAEENLARPSSAPLETTDAREGRARVSRPAREPARAPSASPIDHSLGLETRGLDRAREALDGRRFAEALRLLGEYEAAFPQGRLRPEAMVLRLAALVHSGRHAAAGSLASRLLADDACKPYESRIRSLLREREK